MNGVASTATSQAGSRPTLEGRAGIITGASRGIGAATARAFVAAGVAVALAARDGAALAALAEELSFDGGRAIAVPTDVADRASVERLVDQTVDAFGRLDLAFNNAAGGGQAPTPLAEFPVDAYDSAVAITLRGVFLSMKYEIPPMLETGGGAIVNMSSTAGLEGVGGLAGYVSSKHGVIGLTKVAALDYAERGVPGQRARARADPDRPARRGGGGDAEAGRDGDADAPDRTGPRDRRCGGVAVLRPSLLHHWRHAPDRRRKAGRDGIVQPGPGARRQARPMKEATFCRYHSTPMRFA